MSFGTFNLFNFFQQPNTGIIPARNSYDVETIVEGHGNSGAASEMNWSFPYAGTRIPFEIVEGGGGIFQIRLFSDSDIGLRLARISTLTSGQIREDIDKSSSSITSSGQFFPKDTDTDTSFILFSGIVTGSPPDSPLNSIYISGEILDRKPDYNYPFVIFSGDIGECIPDIYSLGPMPSGFCESGNANKNPISMRLSGKFTPVQADKCDISYRMLSFSGLFNKIVLETSISDDCIIRYGFNSYYSSRS